MADSLAWIAQELDAWAARGLKRTLIERHGPQYGSTFTWQGHEYLNFGSNDYLALAAAPELVDAVREHLHAVGWGAGASPLVTGRGEWHARLERELAQFEGTDAALLFPTGYVANVGTITALASAGDAIFSDAKNHASIIDGCRLSGASVQIYWHGDVTHLDELLKTHGPAARRRLIVTDGLFSMDGDLAPLSELVQLATAHDAMLLVDEAHATGVFGTHGRGVSDECSYSGLVRVGTLSKALGSHGGFVAGPQPLIEWLANKARPYVFSTAAPEALAIAGCTALQLAHTSGARRERLLTSAAWLRAQLAKRGWDIGTSHSQIIPLRLGNPQRTMQAAQALRDRGLWVPGIRPPSVPEGESLLRISLTSGHTRAMLDRLLAGLDEVLQT